MIVSISEILIGGVLAVLGFAKIIDDFWSGMGLAFLIIGAIFLTRQIRYRTNDSYREEVDIKEHDERNRYIGIKAWSWAGYCFVLIAAVGTIVFKLIGREDLMMFASSSVCLVLVLYWISYMILQKKY